MKTSPIQRAVERAKSGGYDTEEHLSGDLSIGKFVSEMFLDPLFWQALGKAEGWKADVCEKCGEEYRENGELQGEGCEGCMADFVDGPLTTIPEWKYRWHRFIDHLASGHSPEEFFEKLLSTKD